MANFFLFIAFLMVIIDGEKVSEVSFSTKFSHRGIFYEVIRAICLKGKEGTKKIHNRLKINFQNRNVSTTHFLDPDEKNKNRFEKNFQSTIHLGYWGKYLKKNKNSLAYAVELSVKSIKKLALGSDTICVYI